jgi:transcription elongation factor Elf1
MHGRSLQDVTLTCPYCGERFATTVDLSAGAQRYVEDCAVCCQPIDISVHVGPDGELLGVDAASDRD